MASEAEIILSFLFKRSGKKQLSFAEGFLSLSMDLNWFNPDSAKSFLLECIKNGLLTKKDEKIMPNFNYEIIEIPTGFYPKNISFEKTNTAHPPENKDIINEIIKKIQDKSKLKKEEIIREKASLEEEKNISAEVALLLIAKENSIALEDFYEQIKEKIYNQ